MTEELIAKLEALEEPDKGIFWEVFHIINPTPHDQSDYQTDYRKWRNLGVWFEATLDCRAWESAAIMLKPEGWEYVTWSERNSARLTPPLDGQMIWFEQSANHPAIALLICILKAKEPVE